MTSSPGRISRSAKTIMKSIDDHDVRVRLAGMVDILGFVPADTSIDVIIGIQLRDVLATRPGQPPHGFDAVILWPAYSAMALSFGKWTVAKQPRPPKGRLHN